MVYRRKTPTRPYLGEEASVTDLPYTLRHHVLLWFTGGTPPPPTILGEDASVIDLPNVTMWYYGLQGDPPPPTILR